MPSLLGKEVGPIGYGTMSTIPPANTTTGGHYANHQIRNDLERAASIPRGVL